MVIKKMKRNATVTTTTTVHAECCTGHWIHLITAVIQRNFLEDQVADDQVADDQIADDQVADDQIDGHRVIKAPIKYTATVPTLHNKIELIEPACQDDGELCRIFESLIVPLASKVGINHFQILFFECKIQRGESLDDDLGFRV
jgi:hypothetical protein